MKKYAIRFWTRILLFCFQDQPIFRLGIIDCIPLSWVVTVRPCNVVILWPDLWRAQKSLCSTSGIGALGIPWCWWRCQCRELVSYSVPKDKHLLPWQWSSMIFMSYGSGWRTESEETQTCRGSWALQTSVKTTPVRCYWALQSSESSTTL